MAVSDSFAAWTAVDCDGEPIDLEIEETTELSECTEAQFRTDGANVHTIAFIDGWRSRGYDPNAFALTTVFHNRTTGEILDADVQLNEDQGPFALCAGDSCLNSATPDAVDLANVLTHEFGHFLGLGHSTFGPATMFASSFRGETSKRILTTDDANGICAVYPMTDSAVCEPTPRGGLDPVCRRKSGCHVSTLSPRVEILPAALWLAFLWRRSASRCRAPRM